MFLFNGCVESLALLGSTAGGAANGKLVQTSLKSAVSYGVKKQTGKSPLEHALTYAKEKNPDKKKERCISSIEKTNSEFCMITNGLDHLYFKIDKLSKKYTFVKDFPLT